MTVWSYFSSFHTSFLRFGYNCSGVSDEIIEMLNVLKCLTQSDGKKPMYPLASWTKIEQQKNDYIISIFLHFLSKQMDYGLILPLKNWITYSMCTFVFPFTGIVSPTHSYNSRRSILSKIFLDFAKSSSWDNRIRW